MEWKTGRPPQDTAPCSVMWRYLDRAWIRWPVLEILDLPAQDPVRLERGVDFPLLPVDDVAQFLQRALQVGELDFDRLNTLRVDHLDASGAAHSSGAAMNAKPSFSRSPRVRFLNCSAATGTDCAS
jgi:hypothetical protein